MKLEYVGDDFGRGKAYLKQIRDADGAIKRKEMQLKELKSCLLPGCIRYDKDKIQSSPSNQMEEVMARVDLLEREIESMKADKALMIIEISDTIDSLESSEEKTVLMGVYIAGESMNKIARVIGYSSQHAYRLRKRGVVHLGEKILHNAGR